MSRKVAVCWHALESLAAGVLYFLFVLPRWPELMGDTSHSLGTAMRIVTGALIGLAALPVVFTLLRTRRPELGTPQLALSLRTASIALHVLAGVLIIGTAISEVWFNLDSAGRWLFGIYGAAAAVALLGIFAFYLAFVAELPPPPPKPLKPKAEKRRRGRRGKAVKEADDEAVEETEETETVATGGEESTSGESDAPSESEEPAETDDKPAEVTAEEPEKTDDDVPEAKIEAEDAVPEPETDAADDSSDEVNGAEKTNGGLRNRRAAGKIPLRRRKRSRGGVAVED